jgi:hypothetical protein
VQKDQARPNRGTSEGRNEMSYRIPLAVRVIDEFHTFMYLSRIRDPYAEFQRVVVTAQDDSSAGIGWKRLAKFQSHAFFADVSASSRHGRLLDGELDWKIDGKSRRTILELLHTHSPR